MSADIDSRLVRIADSLKVRFADVSLRGSGAAAFVFIRANNRAVEASMNLDSIWVEFWDCVNEQTPIPPAKEATFAAVEDAEGQVTKWLTCIGPDGTGR